jgi:hypothetical protein
VGEKTKEEGMKYQKKGEVAYIYVDACFNATAHCAATKLPPVQRHYSARETTKRRCCH